MNDVSFGRSGPDEALTPRLEGEQARDSGHVPLATQYLRVLVRWKWLILGAVSVSLLLAILYTIFATPLYTATTRLEINREASRIVNVEGVEPETSAVDMEFYQTQYGLLQSRSLAERVVRELDLADDREFFTLFDQGEMLAEDGAGPGRDARVRAAADILLDNISVDPIRLSRLVDVRFTSPDPGFSARVANAWAASFIASNLERRFEATSYARKFLEDRLEQLRRRLEESERQLVGYASNQSLINIPTGGAVAEGQTPPERSLTADSLAAINEALAEATADRIRAQSRLGQVQGGAVGEALMNPAITAMREQRAQAAAEYSRLMTQFEPEYPPARAVAAQIEQLDQSIAREETRVQRALRQAYQDNVERERTLAAQLEGLKENFLDQRRRSIQYNIYQRDVDTNRELYDGLLQRYKEIGVAGGVGNNNVAIVDAARVPEEPSHPRPLINLLLALVVGLAIGIGLALLREQMDETISDPADLERRLKLPLLGAIPKTQDQQPREELKDPKSGLMEAYLSVETSLAFTSDHGTPATLAVTSTRPAEGKSTTAYAIAYAIARGGARTVLIDGDMRSPSVHGELGLSNERGLSNYLAGSENVDLLLQKPQDQPFTVLVAGPPPPNAAELLRGPRLNALLAELTRKFDHVVIDSPPVMGLADAPLIASRTEGTVFVIEARAVKARMARRAIERLQQGRARLLGTVLTKFDARRAHLGYGYDYGYGYGYGERYGAAKEA